MLPSLPAGRGLAYEGLGDWVAALKDYKTALQVAEAAGQLPDPYVLNSVGNCHSSLGALQLLYHLVTCLVPQLR